MASSDVYEAEVKKKRILFKGSHCNPISPPTGKECEITE
jgi:hypothetical protein